MLRPAGQAGEHACPVHQHVSHGRRLARGLCKSLGAVQPICGVIGSALREVGTDEIAEQERNARVIAVSSASIKQPFFFQLAIACDVPLVPIGVPKKSNVGWSSVSQLTGRRLELGGSILEVS